MTNAPLPLPEAHAVRAALVARRDACLQAWRGADGQLGESLVLVPSGLVLPVAGSDQFYAFRAHDDHYYLSGRREPAQVLAWDGDAWILFAYVADAEDRVWHGDTEAPGTVGAAVGLDDVRPLSELGAWLAAQPGRPVAMLGNLDLLERPSGYGLHPEHVASLALDADVSERLAACVVRARRVKDDVELDFMRAAAAASRAGHLAGMAHARAGVSERSLGIEVDGGFLRAGADRSAYATIAVSGANCATLHASPGPRLLADGDLVLVDAGAEVRGYDSDVTRTWPVSDRFTGAQRDVYEIVLGAQARAIAGVAAGVEFRELHMEACRHMTQGLVDMGLLRGSVDGLVESDAHALFFPHGLGHLIGLATHDVGGLPPDRERSDRPGLKYLRIDLPLEDGYVVTIEPGLYFVRALLEDPALREKHRDAVDWDRADAMIDFGGVRIEDDVVVCDGSPEILTAAIPKSIDELEALRSA